MPIPPIDPLPSPPNRGSDLNAVFSAKMDALLNALNPWVSQVNDTAEGMDDALAAALAAATASTIGSSTTAATIGTGSKGPFTTQASKNWVAGSTWVTLASISDPTKWMIGQVTAYAGTALTVSIVRTNGAGSVNDWVISLSAPPGVDGDDGGTGAPGASGYNVSALMFGDGTDGDVTISGSVTLTRDMHYNNLTISAGAALETAGFRIHVKGTLDLTAAPANAIRFTALAGGNAPSTSAGGTYVPPTASNLVINTDNGGGDGAAGATGAGTAGQGSSNGAMVAGVSGSGGRAGAPAGALGVAVSGPVARVGMSSKVLFGPSSITLNRFHGDPVGGWIAQVGSSGSSGTGDGSNRGGSSGAPGQPGGAVYIAAATISRGGSTAAGCIAAKGGNAGTSFAPTAGNAGGAGGSSGGGGGLVVVVCGALTGSTAANAIDVSGGNGAAGTIGRGTGRGGAGGDGGGGGRVDIAVIGPTAPSYSTTLPVAPVAGGATATSAAGSAGTATVHRVSL